MIPLRHAGESVGELRVGVRSGQRRLDPADRAVLELMAVPIGVAVRARRSRRRCGGHGRSSSPPGRRSAAGSAATCTTGSAPF